MTVFFVIALLHDDVIVGYMRTPVFQSEDGNDLHWDHHSGMHLATEILEENKVLFCIVRSVNGEEKAIYVEVNVISGEVSVEKL